MRNLFKPRNLLMIVVVLAVMLGGAVLLPVPLPTILLPAEEIFSVAGFPVTNTLITTLIADITLLVIAFVVGRNLKEIPTGFQNLIEWFLEIFYRMTEDIAGKVNARRWFPVFMSIMMFLMVANWWELIPGFDSIGVIEPIEVATAHTNGTVRTGYKLGTFLGIPSLIKEQVNLDDEQVQEILAEHEAAAEGGEAAAESESSAGGIHESKYGAYVLKPLFRAAATDLNVPLALALISVILTQAEGMRVLGLKYWRKFFLPTITGMKPVDAFVGILELISEFAKIISFSFRLFGNVFAGQVLLFVMPFLIPYFIPLPFYGLELFVGFMQAFVFAILTLIFLSSAVVSHEGHEKQGHGAEAAAAAH